MRTDRASTALSTVVAAEIPALQGGEDVNYVAIGAAITYGIDLRPVWDMVHAANMAKEGGATREDGKILKPKGWKAPAARGMGRGNHE